MSAGTDRGRQPTPLPSRGRSHWSFHPVRRGTKRCWDRGRKRIRSRTCPWSSSWRPSTTSPQSPSLTAAVKTEKFLLRCDNGAMQSNDHEHDPHCLAILRNSHQLPGARSLGMRTQKAGTPQRTAQGVLPSICHAPADTRRGASLKCIIRASLRSPLALA